MSRTRAAEIAAGPSPQSTRGKPDCSGASKPTASRLTAARGVTVMAASPGVGGGASGRGRGEIGPAGSVTLSESQGMAVRG